MVRVAGFLLLLALAGTQAQPCYSVDPSRADDNYCNTVCLATPSYCPEDFCTCGSAPAIPDPVECYGSSDSNTLWCNENCNANPSYCPEELCDCYTAGTAPPPTPTPLSCSAKTGLVTSTYCNENCVLGYCPYEHCDCGFTEQNYESSCPGLSDTRCVNLCNSRGLYCPECCNPIPTSTATPISLTPYDQDVCCINEAGSLWFTSNGDVLQAIVTSVSVTSQPFVCAALQNPISITLDSDGNAYVADNVLGQIVRIDKDCSEDPIVITNSAEHPIKQPQTVMISDGVLVAVDIDRTVYIISLNDDFSVESIVTLGVPEQQITDLDAHDGDVWFVSGKSEIRRSLAENDVFVTALELGIVSIADIDVNSCGLYFTTDSGQLWRCDDRTNSTSCDIFCDPSQDSSSCNNYQNPADLSVDCECNVYISNSGVGNIVVTDGLVFDASVDEFIAPVPTTRALAFWGTSCVI